MAARPDVYFTKYVFAASGGPQNGRSPVNRTMPDRLGLDSVNVKDFGAVGDGIADDGPAFLAALAHAFTLNPPQAHGGIVYLPAGTYFIATEHFPIQLGSPNIGRVGAGSGALCLIGAGRDATIIKGTYSTGVRTGHTGTPSAMFLKSTGGGTLNLIRDLTIWNQSTAGDASILITAGTENAPLFDNCHFIAPRGIVMEEACFVETVKNCKFSCGNPLLVDVNRADSAAPGPLAGTVGMYFDQGHVKNCTFEGFEIGLSLSGTANYVSVPVTASVGEMVSGCLFSRCGTGLTTITSAGVGSVMVGVLLLSNEFDRCTIGMRLNNIASGNVISNVVTGSQGPAAPAPISNMVLSGGNVTVTTAAAHNISGSQTLQLVNINPSSFIPPGNTTGLVSIVVDNSTQFHYAHAGAASGFVSGNWNYPMRYAITLQNSQEVLYAANVLNAIVTGASFDVADQGAGVGIQAMSECWSMEAPYGWIHPPHGAQFGAGAAWRFINCDMTGTGVPPIAWMHYNDMAPRYEGDEFTIVDARPQASFGGVVSGGGSTNHYKVRYASPMGWIRVG